MELPFGQPLVVINPQAGRQTPIVALELEQLLVDRLLTPTMHRATSARDVTETCAKAAAVGHGYVIVVGGDGTVRDAINGFFQGAPFASAQDLPVLGIVGSGTGSDFVRTFGLNRPVSTLIDHLVSDAVTRVDVGLIACHTPNGKPIESCFLNVAQIGFGATVTATANHLPRWVGNQRYRAAIVVAMSKFRQQLVKVTLEHTEITEPLLNVVIANGQFYGAGLQVAPQAIPYDGLFDVQAWTVSPRDLPTAFQQLARGHHLGRADVRQWHSKVVDVHGPRPITVEADGDVLGVTPASLSMLARAIRLKI